MPMRYARMPMAFKYTPTALHAHTNYTWHMCIIVLFIYKGISAYGINI